jgi:hypothetical protein
VALLCTVTAAIQTMLCNLSYDHDATPAVEFSCSFVSYSMRLYSVCCSKARAVCTGVVHSFVLCTSTEMFTQRKNLSLLAVSACIADYKRILQAVLTMRKVVSGLSMPLRTYSQLASPWYDVSPARSSYKKQFQKYNSYRNRLADLRHLSNQPKHPCEHTLS